MGLHEQKKEEYANCLREKARSGALSKGSVLNAHRLSEICGGDPRTAHPHMQGLLGLELEGPNYRGKLRDLNIQAGPWAIVDPPSDAWMDKAVRVKRESYTNWVAFGAGLLVGGIIGVAVVSLADLAVQQRQNDIHSWSLVIRADSAILICMTSGGP